MQIHFHQLSRTLAASPSGGRTGTTLPPGQRWVEGFPRFGINLSRPPPAVPSDPVIDVTGPLIEPLTLAVEELATLPRSTVTADFHCVAGWSAADLRWDGVAFRTLYGMRIEPFVPPDVTITHLTFRGLDGFSSVATMDDVLGDDVLLADTLEGRPLTGDHGAPVRLVSPRQYGYMSIKHLCHITLHTSPPRRGRPRSLRQALVRLIKPHPRARVWEEERHPDAPSWIVRPIYHTLRHAIMWFNTGRQRQRSG
jgi:DMSO/TMAO reductase YedYZ molybdopterin-dependent catalytic subunit